MVIGAAGSISAALSKVTSTPARMLLYCPGSVSWEGRQDRILSLGHRRLVNARVSPSLGRPSTRVRHPLPVGSLQAAANGSDRTPTNRSQFPFILGTRCVEGSVTG
jgi:hypothetical protein